MNKIVRLTIGTTFILSTALVLNSCFLIGGGGSGQPTSANPGGISTTTGLAYNEDDGFQVNEFGGQPDGPNLVFIEGGRTVLGSFEEDIFKKRDNIERTVTVASFYMDETEVANINWLEYLFYVKLDSSKEFYDTALPDTTVWAKDLAFNDPYVDHYLRYPGFRYFPVVGISWLQATDYCQWRTAVVNYKLAQDAGLEEFDAAESGGGRIPLETGVVLPDYRLPTEAEWEYAAQALIGTTYLDEVQLHKRLYPWDGHSLRNPYGKQMGYFLANFRRGRGDYAGIAGKLNDGAMITSYVYEYPPNDFGLYNIGGNVSEWVQDVYRPLSFQDMEDLNPIRRDGFLDQAADKDNAAEGGYDNIFMHPQSFNSLITDDIRVYKGASWNDMAYWVSPGTRRFLEQDSSTATIGFRCAMIRAGSNY
ncbi:MAG: gliding motility lipoprotein GldJ [Bacteroidetes bacterium]|nr:gliding motility lipoprotein GldJ [Bacteroidota bacterium]